MKEEKKVNNLEMVVCLLRSGEIGNKEEALKVIQDKLQVTRNNAFVYFTKAKKIMEAAGEQAPASINTKPVETIEKVVENHKAATLVMKPTSSGKAAGTRYAATR